MSELRVASHPSRYSSQTPLRNQRAHVSVSEGCPPKLRSSEGGLASQRVSTNATEARQLQLTLAPFVRCEANTPWASETAATCCSRPRGCGQPFRVHPRESGGAGPLLHRCDRRRRQTLCSTQCRPLSPRPAGRGTLMSSSLSGMSNARSHSSGTSSLFWFRLRPTAFTTDCQYSD